jgi:hypothetical protein
VRLGRTADSLSLPTEVTVTDGAAGRQAQAGVTWDTTGYDPDTAGEYTFTGQLVNLPEFWSNPGGIGAQVTVTVLDQAVVDDRQSETLTFLGDRYSAVLDCGGKAALTSLQVFGRETLDQQAGGGVYSSVVLAAEDPATVNLAMGKATHTSSNNGNTMAGAKAVDGDAGTYWCANGGSFPQSLIVDLGAAAELGLVWQLFADRDNSTYKYQVRGSNDASVLTGSEWNQASKWAVLADRSAGVQQSGAVPTADAVSGTYRYVQLYVTAASNGHWASASEFEVFAEGAPEPTGPRTVTSLDLDESPEIVLDGDTAVVAFSTDAADETWTLTADADKLVFTLDRQYKTGGTLSQQGTPLATYGENAWESMRWAEDGGSYPLGGTSALANLGSWISNPNNGYRLTKEQTSYALLNGATGTALDVAVTQNHAIEGAARGAAGYRTGATEVWRASRGLRLATVVSSAMLDYAGGGDPALTGGISRGYYNAPGCGGQTFATHRHFAADSPLRPSGLLGPVSLLTRG